MRNRKEAFYYYRHQSSLSLLFKKKIKNYESLNNLPEMKVINDLKV